MVRVTKIGLAYTYYGLKPSEVCYPVDFEVIETGEKHIGYSSQYFTEEGFEF